METKRITAKEFFELLRAKRGNLMHLNQKVCVIEDVVFNNVLNYPIYLGGLTFEGVFDCGNNEFKKSFNCDDATFQKDFKCGHATFKDTFSLENATFEHDFHCNNATFEDGFYCKDAIIKYSFYYDNATFKCHFNFESAIIEYLDFNDAKFEKPINFRGGVEIKKMITCLNHKEIAEKALYYKMGVII